MKTIVVLLAICLGSLQSFASSLIIQGSKHQVFSVKHKGVQYYSQNGQVYIAQINPGEQRIQVVLYNSSRGHGKSRTIINTSVYIPLQSIVHANVLHSNNIHVARVEKIAPQRSVAKSRPAAHSSRYSQYYCNAAMSSFEFSVLYRDLEALRFDADRFDYAKLVIARNYFTSEQVYEIVQMFNFEDYRLHIAKIAYMKTVDQYNYDLVFQALKFSSSCNQLSQYITAYTPSFYYENNERYSYNAR